MCLLFFSYKKSPGFSLVLAANRDEFLVRPTASLGYLDNARCILGGRDLQEGGTWLAIDRSLRFAALTNYRDPSSEKIDAVSRGEIIMKYLSGNMSSKEYIRYILREGKNYNGFNVLVGDQKELYYYSNRGPEPILLEPGYYGMSNHLLDTAWPKISRGKKLLYPYMVETSQISPDRVFEVLSDRERPADSELPDTGVGLEWERLLSSIFIESAAYGTRSSALLTIDDRRRLDFFEKTYLRQQAGIYSSIAHLHLAETEGPQ